MNILELRSELHTSETDDNLYFVAALFVDGEALADFRSYAISLAELKRSAASSGAYFVLTCWCGIPECAGIYHGVEVVHKENTVEWKIQQPQPQRVFVFELRAYQRAISDGIEQIKHEIANLWFTPLGEKDEKLQVVPGLSEDMALLKPKEHKK